MYCNRWFFHLYTTLIPCDYYMHISVKSKWCIYFATCQDIFDFSDQLVRHDKSSVHVQGSYGLYESSVLQAK